MGWLHVETIQIDLALLRLSADGAVLTPEILALAGGKGSNLGTGGMETKLRAAEIATGAGLTMVIANGADPKVLYDIVEGKQVGTRFLPKQQ